MILTCYHFEISKNQDLKIFKIPMITYNRILYRKCYICFKFDVFCCYDNMNIKFLTFECTYIIIKNRSIWNRVCQVAVFEVSCLLLIIIKIKCWSNYHIIIIIILLLLKAFLQKKILKMLLTPLKMLQIPFQFLHSTARESCDHATILKFQKIKIWKFPKFLW